MSDAGTMYANAKALHELLQESRAENEELRKERDALDRLTDVLNDTNDGLIAENAKLREQIETLTMYVESDGTRYWVDDDGNQHFDHSATVKDDADKLRELVRDMWDDVCNAPCCAYCDHSDYDGDKCELQDRMRELGVEV